MNEVNEASAAAENRDFVGKIEDFWEKKGVNELAFTKATAASRPEQWFEWVGSQRYERLTALGRLFCRAGSAGSTAGKDACRYAR